MALLDTLRGYMDDGQAEERRVIAKLRELHGGFLARAQRLEASADQAPTESTEDDLRRLAGDHRKAAGLLAAALDARDSSAPAETSNATEVTGRNHWARLVDDLATFQDGRNDLQAVGDALLERHPELTDTFLALTRTVDDHVTRLRGEIARTDPLALN